MNIEATAQESEKEIIANQITGSSVTPLDRTTGSVQGTVNAGAVEEANFMKTRDYLSGIAEMPHFAFVLACLLMVGAGWYSKTAVDRLGQMSDELQSDFMQPSEVYLRSVSGRQKAPASAANPRPTPVGKENLVESSAPD